MKEDAEQVAAAREGLGEEGILLVDAGTVWGHDLATAEARLPALQANRATWLEEPFVSGALNAYRALAERSGSVRIAGGEGSHNEDMARHMIDHGGVGFIQIDAGRIGGLAPAKRVADYARERGVTYVNHTFTSHLALSASLQPYAGHPAGAICEYPIELKSLAWDATQEHITRDENGLINLPEAPGLGVTPTSPDCNAISRTSRSRSRARCSTGRRNSWGNEPIGISRRREAGGGSETAERCGGRGRERTSTL